MAWNKFLAEVLILSQIFSYPWCIQEPTSELLFSKAATCKPATLLKSDSGTGVFLRILRNFSEQTLNQFIFLGNLKSSVILWTKWDENQLSIILLQNHHLTRITHPRNYNYILIKEVNIIQALKSNTRATTQI